MSAIGLVLFGGSMLGLGALLALWLVFGSSLWWDEAAERDVPR